jgi:hypothetical protein
MMQGWCSAEALTLWGFGCSPVVMANEAHSGLSPLCPHPRGRGPRDSGGPPGRGQAPGDEGTAPAGRWSTQAGPRYPAQRRRLPRLAGHAQADHHGAGAGLEPGPTKQSSTLAQARPTWSPGNSPTGANASRPAICISCKPPRQPLLVWCGNGHASRKAEGGWVPMGCHFTAMSGVQPFVIDQTLTVDFPGDGPSPGCASCWPDRGPP